MGTLQLYQGLVRRAASVLPDVIMAACEATKPDHADKNYARREYAWRISELEERLDTWGGNDVRDGGRDRAALTAMVNVWRTHRGDDHDVTVSLKASEWSSFLQRLVVCVIQDDDGVIPDKGLRRVRRAVACCAAHWQ
jgi:hypothetical protein